MVYIENGSPLAETSPLSTLGLNNMAPLFTIISQMAVVSLAALSTSTHYHQPCSLAPQNPPAQASTDAKAPLRLMPLGASITYGQASTTGNGYREDLRNMLTSADYTVDMVGSRKHGTMQDNDVEGWPGFRIEQVQAKAELSVPSRKPNIFTINAGTNDCAQNYKLEDAGSRMGSLMEYVWKASPGSTIILSTLLINLNETIEARVENVNNQIKECAKVKAGENKRVVLVDMHGEDGPQKADMHDDTHPNDQGYAKMAKIWFRGIQEADEKGFLQAPK